MFKLRLFIFIIVFYKVLFATDYSNDLYNLDAQNIQNGDTVNNIKLYLYGTFGATLQGLEDNGSTIALSGDTNTSNYFLGTSTHRIKTITVSDGYKFYVGDNGGINSAGDIKITNSNSQLISGDNSILNSSDIKINANNVLVLKNDVNITSTINGLDAVEGTLNIDGNFTTQAQIGNTNALANININSQDVVFTVNNNIKATDINNSGTVTLANGAIISGAIQNSGTINLSSKEMNGNISDNNGTVNFKDNYTTSLHSINANEIGIASNKSLTDSNLITTNNIIFNYDGGLIDSIITFNSDKNISGNITTGTSSKGILNLNGNAIISGEIGSFSKSINEINVTDNKNLTLNNNTYVNNINLNGNANLILGGYLEGNITSASGYLDVNTQDVNGSIVKTSSGDINITTGKVHGNIDAISANLNYLDSTTIDNVNITSNNIQLNSNSILNIKNQVEINSTINGLDAVEGTLNIDGNFTTQAQIGNTNALANININSQDVVFTVNDNIKATDINNSGTVTLANGAIISGAIQNSGTINLSSNEMDSNISGTLGIVNFTQDYNSSTHTIQANTISVAGGKSVTETQNIIANNIILDSNGNNEAIFTTNTNDKNISGNITTGTSSKGILNLNGNAIISGEIGSFSKSINEINVTDNKNLTLNNNTYVNNINLNGNANLILGGYLEGNITSASGYLDVNTQDVNGSIVKTSSGDINITTGKVHGHIDAKLANLNYLDSTTIDNDVKALNINIADGKIVNLETNITGNIDVLNLRSSSAVHTMDITSTNALLNIDANITVNGSISNTDINISKDITLTTTSTINAKYVHVRDGSRIVNNSDINISQLVFDIFLQKENEIYTLIDTNGSAINIGTISSLKDNILQTYNGTENNGSYNITTTYNSASKIGLGSRSAEVYESIKPIIQTNDELFNEVTNMDVNELNQAFNTMNSSLLSSYGARDIWNSVSRTLDNNIRYEDSPIKSSKVKVWGQYFNNEINQNDFKLVSGYNNTGNGVLFGFENQKQNGTIFGLALSNSAFNIISNDSQINNITNINSNILMAYATAKSDRYYINGILAYGLNQNNSSRDIIVGSLQYKANADYNSQLIASKISFGALFKLSQIELNPFVSFNYSSINTEKYNENGAYIYNLEVSNDDFNSLVSEIGLKLDNEYRYLSLIIKPELTLKISQVSGDLQAESVSTFSNSTTSFTTIGVEQDKNIAAASVGLELEDTSKTYSLQVNLDAKKSKNYDSFNKMISLSIKF